MTAAGGPLVDSVAAAIVGVSDFAPHLDLFCEHLGFDVDARGRLSAKSAARVWQVDTALDIVTLAAAGSRTGRVHLVRVPGAPPAARPHTRDLGLVAVNLYTRDIERAHADLTAAGYPWIAPPSRWQVPVGDRPVDVTEGICLGPDGLNVVLVQPASARDTEAWRADPDRQFTEITSVSAHVPDLDREVAFWEALGVGRGYVVTFSSAGLERMTGLDAGTVIRLAYLTGPTGSSSRIELPTVQTDDKSRLSRHDHRPAQRSGHALGQTGWIVHTAYLPTTVDRAVAWGGTLRYAPFEIDSPPYGRALVAGVETPNGIAVDLVTPSR